MIILWLLLAVAELISSRYRALVTACTMFFARTLGTLLQPAVAYAIRDEFWYQLVILTPNVMFPALILYVRGPNNARFPSFRCRSFVAFSPFCRCKIPLFCKNYVRKFRSVTAVNSKNIRNGSGNSNGVRKRQRLTGTAKR